MKTLDFVPNTSNTGGWKNRHLAAIGAPSGFERPIIFALRAWLDYAREHAARYKSPIGDDVVLGKAWLAWGEALCELLNGDCGRLDCGTLDTILRDNLIEQGGGPY
jgi:hypothetical protein